MIKKNSYKVLLIWVLVLSGCLSQNSLLITQEPAAETKPSAQIMPTITAEQTVVKEYDESGETIPDVIPTSGSSMSNKNFLILDRGNYYFFTAGGSNSTLLASSEEGFIEKASLSPDGTRFAYFKDNFIYIKDLGTQETITLNKEIIGSIGSRIKWSPDGKKLYMSCANDRQPSMAVCAFDTTTGQIEVVINEKNSDKLCASSFIAITFQDISSDGVKIVYSCLHAAEQGQRGEFSVYIYDILSKTSVKVFDSQTQETVWEIGDLLMSPDGKILLVNGANRDHMLNIYFLNLKTGMLSQLTNNAAYHFTATLWQDDNHSFYVHRINANDPYTEGNFIMDITGTTISTLNIQGMITK
jgi:WD40 repeat protein